MSGMVFVQLSWSSGPYGVYSKTESQEVEIDGPGGYGCNTVPVPDAVWERYQAAKDELDEAEAALNDAAEEQIKVARRADSRWVAAAPAAYALGD